MKVLMVTGACLRKLELHVERFSAALEVRMLKSSFLTWGMITCCTRVCLSSAVNWSGGHGGGISPGCDPSCVRESLEYFVTFLSFLVRVVEKCGPVMQVLTMFKHLWQISSKIHTEVSDWNIWILSWASTTPLRAIRLHFDTRIDKGSCRTENIWGNCPSPKNTLITKK